MLGKTPVCPSTILPSYPCTVVSDSGSHRACVPGRAAARTLVGLGHFLLLSLLRGAESKRRNRPHRHLNPRAVAPHEAGAHLQAVPRNGGSTQEG